MAPTGNAAAGRVSKLVRTVANAVASATKSTATSVADVVSRGVSLSMRIARVGLKSGAPSASVRFQASKSDKVLALAMACPAVEVLAVAAPGGTTRSSEFGRIVSTMSTYFETGKSYSVLVRMDSTTKCVRAKPGRGDAAVERDVVQVARAIFSAADAAGARLSKLRVETAVDEGFSLIKRSAVYKGEFQLHQHLIRQVARGVPHMPGSTTVERTDFDVPDDMANGTTLTFVRGHGREGDHFIVSTFDAEAMSTTGGGAEQPSDTREERVVLVLGRDADATGHAAALVANNIDAFDDARAPVLLAMHGIRLLRFATSGDDERKQLLELFLSLLREALVDEVAVAQVALKDGDDAVAAFRAGVVAHLGFFRSIPDAVTSFVNDFDLSEIDRAAMELISLPFDCMLAEDSTDASQPPPVAAFGKPPTPNQGEQATKSRKKSKDKVKEDEDEKAAETTAEKMRRVKFSRFDIRLNPCNVVFVTNESLFVYDLANLAPHVRDALSSSSDADADGSAAATLSRLKRAYDLSTIPRTQRPRGALHGYLDAASAVVVGATTDDLLSYARRVHHTFDDDPTVTVKLPSSTTAKSQSHDRDPGPVAAAQVYVGLLCTQIAGARSNSIVVRASSPTTARFSLSARGAALVGTLARAQYLGRVLVCTAFFLGVCELGLELTTNHFINAFTFLLADAIDNDLEIKYKALSEPLLTLPAFAEWRRWAREQIRPFATRNWPDGFCIRKFMYGLVPGALAAVKRPLSATKADQPARYDSFDCIASYLKLGGGKKLVDRIRVVYTIRCRNNQERAEMRKQVGFDPDHLFGLPLFDPLAAVALPAELALSLFESYDVPSKAMVPLPRRDAEAGIRAHCMRGCPGRLLRLISFRPYIHRPHDSVWRWTVAGTLMTLSLVNTPQAIYDELLRQPRASSGTFAASVIAGCDVRGGGVDRGDFAVALTSPTGDLVATGLASPTAGIGTRTSPALSSTLAELRRGSALAASKSWPSVLAHSGIESPSNVSTSASTMLRFAGHVLKVLAAPARYPTAFRRIGTVPSSRAGHSGFPVTQFLAFTPPQLRKLEHQLLQTKVQNVVNQVHDVIETGLLQHRNV